MPKPRTSRRPVGLKSRSHQRLRMTYSRTHFGSGSDCHTMAPALATRTRRGQVSGVVIEPGSIRRTERFGGMGNTPGVATPDVAIRNKMTSPRHTIPYACDTSFRAVHSNEQQVDLIPSGLCFADQVHPAVAGESRLHRKAHAQAEIVRRSSQNVPSCGHGCREWIQGI